jgi:hypothetical protein
MRRAAFSVEQSDVLRSCRAFGHLINTPGLAGAAYLGMQHSSNALTLPPPSPMRQNSPPPRDAVRGRGLGEQFVLTWAPEAGAEQMPRARRQARSRAPGGANGQACLLTALERKVLWLSTWMIHNANHFGKPGRAQGRRAPGIERLGGNLATALARRCGRRTRCGQAASPVFRHQPARASTWATSSSGFGVRRGAQSTRREPRTARPSISQPDPSGLASG